MTNPIRLPILSSQNFKWLILSFLIGTGVFLLWSVSSLQETDILIPVVSAGIPEGLTITGTPLKDIEVSIRGPKSVLKTLPDLKLQYLLDLSGIDIGLESIPIKKERITLPEGISIVRVNPIFLTVRVEKEIKKELPVKIAYSGKPAAGFTVAGALAKPFSMNLRGPENILDSIEEILTKPVDIKGLSASLKKEIALDLPENIEVVAHSGIILAEVVIEEKIVTKNLTGIIVTGKGTTYDYSIKPSVIDIEVKGPENIIEKLVKETGVKVYVDLKDLNPGIYIRRATIPLPVKTTLIRVKPEIFTVKIDAL
jgi:YbbR domain-containing protein